jgi:hypothetical protein
MLARLMAFSVWLLLGGSVAYWGLQLFSRPLATPASMLTAGEGRSTQVDLLGVTTPDAAPEPEVAVSTRLRLLGVVAPKSARAAEAGEGVALIEVDGVARTVRVGAVVDGELHLLRVDARSASLGRLGQVPSQVLEISPPAAPATGSLAPAQPSPVVLGGNPAAGPAGLPLRAAPPGGMPAGVNGAPAAVPVSPPVREEQQQQLQQQR